MANEKVSNGTRFDPMESWRQMREAYLDVWAKTMVETVNSEAYARATGTMLDAYLTVSGPFREAVEKAMLQTLQQCSMPSRSDIVNLAERLTNLEMRLDDMDAKLDRMERTISRPVSAQRPARPATQRSRRKRTK